MQNAICPCTLSITICLPTGDRGFDPLGLAKPQQYLQFDVDQLDQNKNVNKAGNLLGSFTPGVKSNNDSLAPYDDVFGLERFRETELIHGRWAMLATLGVLIGEASTGVSWSVAFLLFSVELIVVGMFLAVRSRPASFNHVPHEVSSLASCLVGWSSVLLLAICFRSLMGRSA